MKQCRDLISEITDSMQHHAPEGDAPEDIVGLHEAVLAAARDVLATLSSGSQQGQGGHDPGGDVATSGPPTTWHYVNTSRVNACQAKLETLRDRLDNDLKREEAARDAEDRARWREWVHEALEAGGARAHAFSRTPEAWVPTVEKTSGGALSCAPEALLNGQRDKYKRLWRPAAGPIKYQWQKVDELPIMTPAGIREAAKTFKRSTATTFDGLHPRQVAHLCDEGLATLAIILQAVEVGGIWPRQISLVVTPLLPKAKGGFRPIGLLPAVCRVWAKARRRWTDEWEEANTRGYLSAARGNGPLDTMWRLAARQEEVAGEGPPRRRGRRGHPVLL